MNQNLQLAVNHVIGDAWLARARESLLSTFISEGASLTVL